MDYRILQPPEGYIVRPAAFRDLESVLHLITAQNMADYGDPLLSLQALRQSWQSPDLALESDTWVVLSPEERIVGYAELSSNRAGTRFPLSLYLAAGHQDQDIGGYLVQRAEARALALAESAGAASVRLIARASERNRAGQRVLEGAGFGSDLSFDVMEIGLTSAPAQPRWPDGITVRVFRPGQDEQATYRADEEASEDKGYHAPLTFDEWARRMSLHQDSFDPTLWFLACQEEEIAGVALNFTAPEGTTGWVDHLGVRRAWRKRGIGMALLLHSFGEFYRRGVEQVQLTVDSKSLTHAPRLYDRAGMRTIQRIMIYSKEPTLRP